MLRFLCFGIILLWANGIQGSFLNIPSLIESIKSTKEENTKTNLEMAQAYRSFNKPTLEEFVSAIRPLYNVIIGGNIQHANVVRNYAQLLAREGRNRNGAYIPDKALEGIINSLMGASKAYTKIADGTRLYEQALLRQNLKENAQGNMLLSASYIAANSALNVNSEQALSSLIENYDNLVNIFSSLASANKSNKYESDFYNLEKDIYQQHSDFYKQFLNILNQSVAGPNSVVAVINGLVFSNVEEFLNQYGQAMSKFGDAIENLA